VEDSQGRFRYLWFHLPCGVAAALTTGSAGSSVTPGTERARAILAVPDPGTVHGAVPAWLGPGAAEVLGLAPFLDHTLLAPDATASHVARVADEGRALGVAGVCVDGTWTRLVREQLSGSSVCTIVVVGFPHGATTTAVKAFEARQAVEDGAEELDMVMAIGRARGGEWGAVRDDIAAVVQAAPGVPVKVILETILLEPVEIVEACLVAKEAGARFVKSSTGTITAGGAREASVRLMRRAVGDEFGVKASGGVRTAEVALRMLAAGANRIGTSGAPAMLAELGTPLPTLAQLFARHAPTH
jgi:deoxyribose-phosphate aldolase